LQHWLAHFQAEIVNFLSLACRAGLTILALRTLGYNAGPPLGSETPNASRGRGGGVPLPSQLGGMGERRKFPSVLTQNFGRMSFGGPFPAGGPTHVPCLAYWLIRPGLHSDTSVFYCTVWMYKTAPRCKNWLILLLQKIRH